MHNKSKTDSPVNGVQLYVDGRRYRSIFEASIETGISFRWICHILKKNKGAPTKVHESLTVVTEKWILDNPEYFFQIAGGA